MAMVKSHRVSDLHPATVKMLKKGHPWVTPDKFSLQFPQDAAFIIGRDGRGEEICLLLNDPSNTKIKAWLWSMRPPLYREVENFKSELERRLIKAIEKRVQLAIAEKRKNYFLVFGEADFLPGLFIQIFNNQLVIQKYSAFWTKKETALLKCLSNALLNFDFAKKGLAVWLQERNIKRKKGMKKLTLPAFKNIPHQNSCIVQEFGLDYHIYFQRQYDLGLYSDMAAIREKLNKKMQGASRVLNLFAYTGAYSLSALKNASEVWSVDLSARYMKWLEENILLNKLDHGHHHSLVQSTEAALSDFKKNKQTFDFIICDPPSASSDESGVSNAFKAYNGLLPKLMERLETGGKMAIFLNTHSLNRKKFENKMSEILEKNQYKFVIEDSYKLIEDCQTLKGFPEGDYLKGLLIQKK